MADHFANAPLIRRVAERCLVAGQARQTRDDDIALFVQLASCVTDLRDAGSIGGMPWRHIARGGSWQRDARLHGMWIGEDITDRCAASLLDAFDHVARTNVAFACDAQV